MADVNKSVSINYSASTQDLEKALKKIPGITDEQAKKAAGELDKSFKKMEGDAERTSKSVSTKMKKVGKSMAAVAAGAAAAATAAVAFGQKVADLTNELVDASTKTGIAVDTLAGLRLAAEGSGLSFANLEGGLIKFQSSMLDASRGSKDLSETFKRLGVDVKDSNGQLRDADSVFNDAVSSLGQMENATERNALAMKIFGRQSGPALIQSGALDNLESMTQLASEFGISIEQDAIGSMGQFQREMAAFGLVADGVMQRLIESIAGKNSLNQGINGAAQAMIYLGSITGDIIALMGQGFESTFALVAAGAMAMSGDFEGAKVLMQDMMNESETVVLNVANSFARASAEVDKFNELHAASTAPGTMQKTAEQTQRAETSMKALAAATAQTNTQMAELDEYMTDTQSTVEDLLNQVGDRGMQLFDESEVDKIKDLGRQLEFQRSLIQDQIDFQTQGAEQTAEVQERINALKVEQMRLDFAIAQNAKLEQQELLDFYNTLEQTQRDAVMSASAGMVDVFKQLTTTLEVFNERAMARFEDTAEKAHALNDKLYEQGFRSAETHAIHRKHIEDKLQADMQNAKMKEYRLGQASALADIAFSTAKAIAQALVLPPIARGIAIGAISATSGLQVAAVAAQPPPKFDVGGMVGSSTDSAPDQVNATLLSGEAVLDRSTVRELQAQGADVRTLQNMPGTGLQRVFIIQPFKHHDRYQRVKSRREPRRVGSGAY
tara:strand:+ start:2019 stop:4190 length:2172 start_codon:yes stop_codon:yes gene_type:complete